MRWPHQKREDRGRRRKRPSHPPSATGQRFRWQPRQKKGTKSEREDGSEEVTGNRGNLLSRPCETGLSEPRAAHHGHEGHLQLKLILSKFGPKLPSGNESATPIFKPASPSQMKNGRKRKVVACSKHTVMVSVLASLFILLPILSSAAPISHPAVTNQSGHLNKASGSGALGGILASVGAVLALAGAVVWWQNRSRSPEGQQNFPTDDESGTKLQSGDDIENTSLRKDRSAKVVTNFRSCEKSAIHIPVTIKANVHSAISSFASYRWRIISDIYSTCSDNRKHHRVWQELQPKSEENVQEAFSVLFPKEQTNVRIKEKSVQIAQYFHQALSAPFYVLLQ
ncbi:hypothetical protein DFJ73DRAFT_503948 [Zopfochytrium polystomum]|nr:hypothetical protein DFJ73DRAFT_503948 [Zopfochytrium polystomum]